MENWTDYLLEEEGYKTHTELYGFCSYKISGDELFCGHLFVNKAARRSWKGIELANKMVKIAKENKCKYLTGNIWFDGNDQKFLRKMELFTKFGFKISNINNNVAVMIMEI